eukprot:2699598-Pyramimonas_sp.AAC.1
MRARRREGRRDKGEEECIQVKWPSVLNYRLTSSLAIPLPLPLRGLRLGLASGGAQDPDKTILPRSETGCLGRARALP